MLLTVAMDIFFAGELLALLFTPVGHRQWQSDLDKSAKEDTAILYTMYLL